MKNFKKVIALVLAVAMTLSTFTSAFAEDATKNDDKATTLNELGLFAGKSVEEFVPALEDGATRAEAIKIIGTSLGWDVEDVDSVEGFDDVPAWAAPFVAYALENEITNGVGDDKFGSDDAVTERQVLTWYYRALGFDGNVWSTPSLLVTAKLASQATVDAIVAAALAGEEEGILRDDIVGIMFDSLQWKADGKETTLIADLIAANVVDKAAAIEAGVYAEPVVPFAVVGATANNLKDVVVTFNKAGDAAKLGDTANYLVNTAAPVAAKVSDDKMSVTLTLATDIDQQGTIEVKVKKEAGLAADATVKAEKVLDVNIPVVESIQLTGPKEFTVTFTEPIETAGTITVNNGIYGVSATAFSADRKVLTVTLASTLTSGTTYDVKVAGYKDYATFVAIDKTLQLAYTKDATAPTVELVSASQTEVKIKFSKKVFRKDQVGPAEVLTAAYFYHTYNAWQPVAVTTTDNQTFTLSFKDSNAGTVDYYLPEGTSIVTVLKSAGDVKIVDAWGNELAADAKLTAAVSADSVAPTIVKVEAAAENKLEITFDEAVTTTAANYTIKKGADAANTGAITLAYADKKATLTFANKLAGGVYTVEVKDVVDSALSSNKIATVTKEFTVTDKTPATISSAVVVENVAGGNTDPEFVYITFNEDMTTTGTGSILDLANYQLNGTAMPDGSKVELFLGSNAKVKLTVPAQTVTLVGATKISVGRLADVAGNKIVALATPVTISGDTAPTVDNVKTLALNKVQFTVTGLLDPATVTADGITINGDGDGDSATLASVVSVDKKDGKTTVVAMIQATENVVDAADVVNAITVAAGKWKSETGKEAVINGAITYTDGIAPTFVSLVQGATVNTLEVTFDETLNAVNAALAATDLVLVDKDGKTFVPGTDYTVALNAAKLVITLTGKNTYNGKLTISTKATGVVYTYDAASADNKVAAFTGKEVTVDQTAPTVTTIPGDDSATATAVDTVAIGASFNVVFSEALTAAAKTNVENAFEAVDTDFSYTWNGATLTVTNSGVAPATAFSADITANIADAFGNVTTNATVFNY